MRSPYYCNLNGKYGLGAYAQPDYPTLSDLLAAMDRLGIWQTVAYHSNACDLHPVFGNRFLLEDLEKMPEARGRIIPALSANPAMTVGKGEMEHLEECLASGKAGCIVLFPATNRFRMVEYRRVFDRIRKYSPVVLIDKKELKDNDLEDLAWMAPDYPELKFVIKQIMWDQFSRVFDLMLRTENIYCDTSWFHYRDAMKMVCEHIGYQRLLFSAGNRSDGGAAIASLSWLKRPQQEKNAIAYDNFVALLPEKERERVLTNRKIIDDQINNRFWKGFMREEGIYDTLVIDAHTHIGPFTRSWYLVENEIEDQIEVLKEEMERFGIDKIVSQPETALFGQPLIGNDMVEQAITDKEHFRGNLVFNPIYSHLYTEEVLDNYFKGGYFCGFKLLPEYLGVYADDPRFAPAYEYANKHHMHILFHSWVGKYGTPNLIASIAEKYPNATFIIGHTGGDNVGRRQSEAIAQDHRFDNCVFEFCGSFVSSVPWEDSLKQIDYRRVVFGTDTYVHDVAWEMGRLLSLDIPETQLEAILGANMQKVLDKTQLPV